MKIKGKNGFVCVNCDISALTLTDCRPKKWNEHLQKPQLDYSEIFDEDVGQIPGQLFF